jgi:hypothetical protein
MAFSSNGPQEESQCRRAGAGLLASGAYPADVVQFRRGDGDLSDPWDRDVFNLILELTFQGAEIESIQRIEEPF